MNPAGFPFSGMAATAPLFGFTKQQQQMLELALLDFSDREIVRELGITDDSLKKRWRAIYRAISRIEPGRVSGGSGADIRRALLQSLRHNMSELRPYR